MHETYSAHNIQVLKGLEHVRKRPSMYIGSTSLDGLHQLVFEIVDNSIDEALVGACSSISVQLLKGNVVLVEDDGRGIPVDVHPTEKISALEVVMTKLNAGGKFDKNTYKVSGGLHGVGASVVNALSEWCEVEVHREGKIYYQRYVRGAPEKPVSITGDTTRHGTMTRFKPDKQIFEDIEFSFDVLSNRLRELAFLTKGIHIAVSDERALPPKSHIFHFDGGVKSFIEFLNKNKDLIHQEPVYFDSERDHTRVEVGPAVQRRVQRDDLHLREQHQHPRGRDPPHRVQERSDPVPERLPEEAQPLQEAGREPQRRGRAGRHDRCHLGEGARAPVRGADKGSPGQFRGEGNRGEPDL